MKNKAQNLLILFTVIFSGCFATNLSDNVAVAEDIVAHVDAVMTAQSANPVEGNCSVEVIESGEALKRGDSPLEFDHMVKALSDKNVLKKFKKRINDLQVEEVLKRLSAINAVGDLKEQVSKAEIQLLGKQLQDIKEKINKHDKSDKKSDELYITMFLRSFVYNPLKDMVGCAWGVTKNITVSYIVAIFILSVIAEVLPIGPGELFGYFGVNMWSVLYTGFYKVPVAILAIIFGALFGGAAQAADAVVCNPWVSLFTFGYVCI